MDCFLFFNGPFGAKQHLIQSDPVSDGSPPRCPLVIAALSVSVNCRSLVRVRLMTLSITVSPAIINLTPLKTAHYGMHLICCQEPCVVEPLCGWWMMCCRCQCCVNQRVVSFSLNQMETQKEICHAGMLHYPLLNNAGKHIVNREYWSYSAGTGQHPSVQMDGGEGVMDWLHLAA